MGHSTEKIEEFLGKVNCFHPTIEFTAEISETEITFLDTKVYKGETFHKKSILDVQTHTKETFEENTKNFKSRISNRCNKTKHLLEVQFSVRKTKLEQKNKAARKKILPFVTQYQPALPSLKKILMGKWQLIQNQP